MSFRFVGPSLSPSPQPSPQQGEGARAAAPSEVACIAANADCGSPLLGERVGVRGTGAHYYHGNVEEPLRFKRRIMLRTFERPTPKSEKLQPRRSRSLDLWNLEPLWILDLGI